MTRSADYLPVRPSAIVTGRRGGTLVLATPWARQAIGEETRQDIADRIPDHRTLYLSARRSRYDWSVRLYDRENNPAEPTVELLHRPYPRQALEEALARGRTQDRLCWFCLQHTDDDARRVTAEGREEWLCGRCVEKGDEASLPVDYMEDEDADRQD